MGESCKLVKLGGCAVVAKCALWGGKVTEYVSFKGPVTLWEGLSNISKTEQLLVA